MTETRSNYSERDKILQDEASAPLDIRWGYPRILDEHRPLLDILERDQSEVLRRPEQLDRQEEVRQIGERLGLRPDVVLPSATAGISSFLQHVSSPGSSIITFAPSWPVYADIARDMSDGPRFYSPQSADSIHALHMALQKFQGAERPPTIVVNMPRNPDMFVPDETFLEELARLADMMGSTVLYDESFYVFHPDVHYRNGVPVNPDIPRAAAHMTIRDTGKYLPRPFPKVAVGEISEEALRNGARTFQRRAHSDHYDSPSVYDMRALSNIIGSEEFPEFLKALDIRIAENRLVLEESLKEAELPVRVSAEGPFAVLDIRRMDLPASELQSLIDGVSLDVLHDSDFSVHEGGKIVRVPIVRNETEIRDLCRHVASKLHAMQRLFSAR